jgi:hypothetical protein
VRARVRGGYCKCKKSINNENENIIKWLQSDNYSTAKSVNEYDILKKLNAQYKKDQKNGLSKKHSALSEDSLNAITNYKEYYTQKIYNLQKLFDKQLSFVGYDHKQINAIRNFDGSEKMIKAAATTISVDVGFRNKKYISSGTTVDLIAAFNSKGITSNWWNDIFSVIWSEPLTVSSCKGYVEYRDTYYLNSQTITHNPRAGGVYAREIEFSKYINAGIAKYVYAGSMIIHLKSNTKVLDFAAYAAYGYTGASLTGVGIDVSYPGGLSIQFGTAMTKAGSAYASL